MAVSAFSPPDKSIIFCKVFPGGWTIISIPQFKISWSLLNLSDASPPPNISLNVSAKLSLITLNCSLNCSSINTLSCSIMPISFSSDCLISSLFLIRNWYFSLTSAYSSTAFILTLPRAFIWFFKFLSSLTKSSELISNLS